MQILPIKSIAKLRVILLTSQFFLSAWKWQKSLAIHNLEFGFWHLLKSICIGTFFNNFLPTAIGGDAQTVRRSIAQKWIIQTNRPLKNPESTGKH